MIATADSPTRTSDIGTVSTDANRVVKGPIERTLTSEDDW